MPEMPSEARERPSEAVSARPGVPACPEWLREAVADALGCERRDTGDGPAICWTHTPGALSWPDWPCPEAARVAAALAPEIEKRAERVGDDRSRQALIDAAEAIRFAGIMSSAMASEWLRLRAGGSCGCLSNPGRYLADPLHGDPEGCYCECTDNAYEGCEHDPDPRFRDLHEALADEAAARGE